jgi:hypothetical protein
MAQWFAYIVDPHAKYLQFKGHLTVICKYIIFAQLYDVILWTGLARFL